MSKLRDIYLALRDNLSNVFSIIGIVLTVYFAVFYVPNYVEELEDQKIQEVHAALMESIQELIYNDHEVDNDDLVTLIRGKELAERVQYPYSPNDLLIQVQNKFLENKFIPLDQRKQLIEKIDQVRASIPQETQEREPVDESRLASLFSSENVLSLFSVIAGIGAALMGSISIWVKNKVFEEAKLEASIEEREDVIMRTAHVAQSFEREMYDTLKRYLGPDHVEYCPPSTPVDFLIRSDNGKNLVLRLGLLKPS